MNKKIGAYLPDGGVQYPSLTIAGNDYQRGETDPAPAMVHNLPGGHFAVGEVYLPRGFDVNAELAKLAATLAPAVPVVEVTDDATGQVVLVPTGDSSKKVK